MIVTLDFWRWQHSREKEKNHILDCLIFSRGVSINILLLQINIVLCETIYKILFEFGFS